MKLRIIVGPEGMYVERHAIRSDIRKIDEAHGPNEVRAMASALWKTIRMIVSWKVWVTHRLRMAAQRYCVAMIQKIWPGPYYQGPRAGLISSVPWGRAKLGEWALLPSGVASRLIRECKGELEAGE